MTQTAGESSKKKTHLRCLRCLFRDEGSETDAPYFEAINHITEAIFSPRGSVRMCLGVCVCVCATVGLSCCLHVVFLMTIFRRVA